MPHATYLPIVSQALAHATGMGSQQGPCAPYLRMLHPPEVADELCVAGLRCAAT